MNINFFDVDAKINLYESERENLLLAMKGDKESEAELYKDIKPIILRGNKSDLLRIEREFQEVCSHITREFSISEPEKLNIKRFFSLIDNIYSQNKKTRSIK